MNTSEIFTPSPDKPHPYFKIEWSSQIWELTGSMSCAVVAGEKAYPMRRDKLENPLALNSYFWMYPDDSALGYRLEPAITEYYDKVMLDRLVNASIDDVETLLNWHFENAASQEGFVHYIKNIVANDRDYLTTFDHLVLEIELRSFESTHSWLAIKRSAQLSVLTNSTNDKTPKKRALSHRAYMLMLILLDVPKQLRDTHNQNLADTLADLIDFNKRKTYDILFASERKMDFDPFDPKVVQELYGYCQQMNILTTPLGMKVAAEFNETRS